MKKLFILSTVLLLSLLAVSQVPFSYNEGETAVVYSLPKTELCVRIETEKISQKPGMFYRYSERYLATNKVITEEKTIFRLKSLTVKTRAIADPNRTYSFVPDTKLQTNQLTVNSQGILCGVNVTCDQEVALPNIAEFSLKDIVNQEALLPLGEEYMMAGSEAKLAEGAAKQIYRIRESRLSLLTADIDKLPADGDSFKSMLDGMNKMERELTELFIGKTITETQTQNIYLTPNVKQSNVVLFRLSALKGIVPSDDLSGTPYYINVIPTEITTSPTKNLNSKSEKTILYYVLPASTQVSIGDGINTLYNNQFFIPQFGKIIPLNESLFKIPHLKIKIDHQTGRLLSIE
jgi:hypothetical protein